VRHSTDALDLSPYVGRWVALVRGRVAGVGRTADEATHAAHAARPKEKPELYFVYKDNWQELPLLRRLWSFIGQQGVEALLVGGAVRDGLLGRALHDLDFVVAGDAMVLAVAVSRAFGGALVPLDRERDIARVALRHRGRAFDLDFARRQGDDWVTDLRLRDFTVNAIAIDRAGHYLDPLDGRGDLKAAQLRATHADALRDDPLRTLRAVRLVAELGLTIEPQTVAWIQRDAPLLPVAAAERIRDEFVRILDAPGACRHLALMAELELLKQVLPEAVALAQVQQSAPHQWDAWTHTRLTVAALEQILDVVMARHPIGGGAAILPVPGWVWGDLEQQLGPLRADLRLHLCQVVSDVRERRFVLKLAALLHDVGKSQTRTVGEDGRVHFYEHEALGVDVATRRLQALRFSSDEIALVRTVVAQHLRPGQLAQTRRLTRRAIYRYFKATGDVGVEIGLLSLADTLAIWGPTLSGKRWQRQLEVVTALLEAFFDQPQVVCPAPLIDGHELMKALTLSPGPEVGRLLEAIREAQAIGTVKTREAALALAAELYQG
jgi:putative nucleotidyltransferase with HDIG domain